MIQRSQSVQDASTADSATRSGPYRGGTIVLMAGSGTAEPWPGYAHTPRIRSSIGVEAQPVQVLLANSDGELACWLTSSVVRIFPTTQPGSSTLELLAPRNGRIACQACIRNNSNRPQKIACSVRGLDQIKSQVRFVGLVPIIHFTGDTETDELDGIGCLPGLVPDPLLPQTEVMIGSYERRSFWITLDVPHDAAPSTHMFKVHFRINEDTEPVVLPVTLTISRFVVELRRNFHVIHWWRGEATWDYYRTSMFEDNRWWELTRNQLENMFAHGSDVVYVPNFFSRREILKETLPVTRGQRIGARKIHIRLEQRQTLRRHVQGNRFPPFRMVPSLDLLGG